MTSNRCQTAKLPLKLYTTQIRKILFQAPVQYRPTISTPLVIELTQRPMIGVQTASLRDWQNMNKIYRNQCLFHQKKEKEKGKRKSKLIFLFCVFTYIYSFLIEKDICDHRNVSIKIPCVSVCLSSEPLFIYSVRVSSFFSYFYIIRTWVLSFPRGLTVFISSIQSS